MSQRDLGRDIARGRRAAAELQETAAAFEAVRQALLDELVKCPVGADAKILKLHMSLQNLAAVREVLVRTVAAGEHAAYARIAADEIAVTGLTRP